MQALHAKPLPPPPPAKSLLLLPRTALISSHVHKILRPRRRPALLRRGRCPAALLTHRAGGQRAAGGGPSAGLHGNLCGGGLGHLGHVHRQHAQLQGGGDAVGRHVSADAEGAAEARRGGGALAQQGGRVLRGGAGGREGGAGVRGGGGEWCVQG